MRRPGLIVLFLLVTQAGLIGWQAWRYSPTLDEPSHLAAGISHWRFGRFDLYRVNPPLVRLIAALPMLVVDPKTDWSGFTAAAYARPEFSIGSRFVESNGFDSFWYFTLARWAFIPLILVGGYYCYRWGRDLYGEPAGIVSLTLWCFCPNILGNGALITPDVPAAALGVTAGYYFWRWLRSPGWPAALAAGLTLGLAELTKSTWIILFGLWPLLWFIWKFCSWRAGGVAKVAFRSAKERPFAERKATIARASFLQLAAILLLGLYLLNLGYAFENSFQRLDKFQFISRSLGGPDAHKTPGNRFAGSWLGVLPVPVPANYLAGIDIQRYDFEVEKWSYLRGEQKKGGWWYYYLYALAVKTPHGTQFLFVLACIISSIRCISRAFCRRRCEPNSETASDPPQSTTSNSQTSVQIRNPRSEIRNRRDSIPIRTFLCDSLVLVTPALALLILVSSQTGFNRYLRYVVPALPFLFIFASKVAQNLPPFVRGGQGGSRSITLRACLVAVSLAATVISSLSVFPHSLSYFNELAGGPANGPAHLLDANIDWGQDLLELKRWSDAHPEARPLFLTYFGYVSPRAAGLDLPPIPAIADAAEISGANLTSGWYAISVNELHGYKHNGHEQDHRAWLRQFWPAARAGWSIYIYHITQTDIDWLTRDSGTLH